MGEKDGPLAPSLLALQAMNHTEKRNGPKVLPFGPLMF